MNIAGILSPLFLCVFAGTLMGRWRKLRPEPFVTAVMDLFMPALVFDSLLSADLTLSEMITISAASASVIGLLWILCLLTPLRPLRSFALPVLFMNAGFLGIPLMDLAYGTQAIGRIVVYDQIQSLLMFTLGIWIAAPRDSDGGPSALAQSLKAFATEPLIYAILLGGGLHAAGITLSESILKPVRYVGSAAAPLALFALGLRLAATPLAFLKQPETLKKLIWILVLRFGGGLCAGYIVCAALGLDGINRNIVLIASALPSAVFSYILAERYNAEPDLAAGAVFISTILSVAVLPILLKFMV